MDKNYQQNFVPQKPVVIGGISSRKKKHVNLFYVLSVSIFFLTLAAAAGMFLFQQSLMAENEVKKRQLEQVIRDDFDQELAQTFTTIKTRVEAGSVLLGNHLSPSAFLEFLEQMTVRNLRFTDFNFSALPAGGVTVNTRGVAASYNALAFQSELFKNSAQVLSAEFSNLNLDQEGNVVFDLRLSVNPSLISYRTNVLGSGNVLQRLPSPEPDLEEEEENENNTLEEGLGVGDSSSS